MAAAEANRPTKPSDASTSPRNLKVSIKEQRLTVEWQDGRTSELALALLRRNCPCASCREDRKQRDQNPLQVLSFDPSGIGVTHAELVGSYAIQFHWSDGHKDGIFDFRFLRELDDGS